MAKKKKTPRPPASKAKKATGVTMLALMGAGVIGAGVWWYSRQCFAPKVRYKGRCITKEERQRLLDADYQRRLALSDAAFEERAVVEGALARQERAEAWAALQDYYKDAQGPLSQTEWDAIQELYTLWDFGAPPGERINPNNTNSRLRKGNLSRRWGYPTQRAFAVTAPVPGGAFLRREVGTLESRSRERKAVYDQAMRNWAAIKGSPRKLADFWTDFSLNPAPNTAFKNGLDAYTWYEPMLQTSRSGPNEGHRLYGRKKRMLCPWDLWYLLGTWASSGKAIPQAAIDAVRNAEIAQAEDLQGTVDLSGLDTSGLVLQPQTQMFEVIQ